MKDAEQLGSLLRLEEEIPDLIEKERKTFAKEGVQLTCLAGRGRSLSQKLDRKIFGTCWRSRSFKPLDAFAREQAEKGIDQSYFAGVTTKGLRLLEVLNQRFDVVVTNPPYLSGRKMNARLKKLVAEAYKPV